MKRFLSLILTIAMALSMLTACGGTAAGSQNALADKSLEDILAAVYEEKSPEFPLVTTPVDLADANSVKYFTGLDDSSKVKEAIVSEAAIGSQAYSLVLLRVNDAADAEAIAEAVKTGIDSRKWICVEADDMASSVSGDVVMFVMISSAFADSITAADLTDAFNTAAGLK